jgi:hypothetical protein
MPTLTVGQLLEALDEYDPATEVMIVHQPSWPLAEQLAGVVASDERAEHDEDLDGEDDDDRDAPCVWLVAAGHAWDRSPYGPRWAFAAVGAGQ